MGLLYVSFARGRNRVSLNERERTVRPTVTYVVRPQLRRPLAAGGRRRTCNLNPMVPMCSFASRESGYRLTRGPRRPLAP